MENPETTTLGGATDSLVDEESRKGTFSRQPIDTGYLLVGVGMEVVLDVVVEVEWGGGEGVLDELLLVISSRLSCRCLTRVERDSESSFFIVLGLVVESPPVGVLG